MQPQSAAKSSVVFGCPERVCSFNWHWRDGYLCQEDGRATYPTNVHKVLKPALIREHGYMYIASVDGHKRTWRCAVRGCSSTIVNDI